ncbi:hypothetical protein [Rugamonas rivuli]|uniref:Uncharacterized protein n=1 Tax=Rugamonas rivuli TaxID=2743358 RepID=A0A843SGM5_9BURK|nr:hypothetical protein [Rugamonas rivuli]MQA21280.1 hypothetical protein [Rugamonas rivuli]
MTIPIDPDADRGFRTYIPDAVWDDYFLSLGKFFHEYARMENVLNILLSNLLEEAVFPSKYYTPPISDEERIKWFHDSAAQRRGQEDAAMSLQRKAAVRAVLGSMRFKSMRDSFKRLLNVTNADPKVTGELERIFSHLGEIQFLRDRLAHNGATPDMTNKENWFSTSDSHTQNLQEKTSTIYFKAGDLLDMARDLHVIPDLIFEVFNPEIKQAIDADPLMQTQEMKAHLDDKRGPFRYKPSQIRRVSHKQTTADGK